MNSIFSCFTRPTPIDIAQAFTNASNKASKANRVSSSNLNALLRSVENSQKTLSKDEFIKIEKETRNLTLRLFYQHSKIHDIKKEKLSKIESLVKGNTPKEIYESALKDIDQEDDEIMKKVTENLFQSKSAKYANPTQPDKSEKPQPFQQVI